MAETICRNPFVVKEILGHKRLSTTERYCHPTAPILTLILDEITAKNLTPERGIRSVCKIIDPADERAG